jgi:hypothetical protein
VPAFRATALRCNTYIDGSKEERSHGSHVTVK